ncbi:MAG TPA: non-ribosomal peptide synthetase [Vicinamibacterales bacterium]|nr:non-ribosomal peptide synthetase [Vicinamibacterales bacterium]
MQSQVAVERVVRTFLSSFHEQVARRGTAPAVTQGAVTLTYGQLDRRSTALARHLTRHGVRQETLVGLMLDRSPDLLVALVAILKAGAAYLPLDPAFPADRLAFMIADARPAEVITHSALASRLPPHLRPICIDRDAAAIQAHGDEALAVEDDPSSLAYVIYTSGSTGEPKGVEIPRRAVDNLLDSFAVTPGMRSSDVVLAHTTLSFDIAVIELWLPLTVGAHIVLADAERGTDARRIADLLARHGITFLQATPSLWRLLLEGGWRNGRGLTALSGGEALSRELADALLATGATLWNVYGPTETTVWSALWKVERDGPILIGHPIRETALHVLDETLQPVNDGEIGELCISGAGVARGYRDREALTADRFPPHPIAMPPDGRLYRTGDLVRAHGARGIECLGRTDEQIKIDGFRIEPGEVEAALSLHSAVERALVCAVEREPGDKRLVAYVIHDPAAPPRVEELIALTRAKLPAHMVPSAFVLLTRLPMTPNGKVDRRALPAPDWRPAGAGAAPGTMLERRLAAIWADVLGIADIGVDDNFFDIGGRSRLGAQVFARIETDLGARLPLATLFESPTIRGLAAAIARSERTPALWRPLVPIRRRGTRLPLFCVHPVGGNVLAYRDLVRRLGSDVPCYGLQSIGLDGITPPLTSVEDMARRYVDELRSVQPHGPYQLCGFSFGGLVAFEMALALRAADQEVGLLALLDTEFPDYPALAPLGWLARSGVFRTRVYPALQRARRHARSLRRLGMRGYVRATAPGPQAPAPAADPFSIVAERVRKANTRAAIHYVPRPFDGRVTYFRAEHAGAIYDDRQRWAALARDAEIVDVAGGHSDLRQEPQVQIVARVLLERIEQITGASRGVNWA